MITKERLQDLIKQGANIYFVFNDIIDEKEGIYNDDFILNETYVSIFWNTRSHQVRYEHLFETRKDAEWYKKFGCIERTERLELPTWENFKKLEFYTRKSKIIFEKDVESYPMHPDVDEWEDVEFIEIWELTFDGGDCCHFHELSTKENYIKACEIARKLFLGENV